MTCNYAHYQRLSHAMCIDTCHKHDSIYIHIYMYMCMHKCTLYVRVCIDVGFVSHVCMCEGDCYTSVYVYEIVGANQHVASHEFHSQKKRMCQTTCTVHVAHGKNWNVPHNGT